MNTKTFSPQHRRTLLRCLYNSLVKAHTDPDVSMSKLNQLRDEPSDLTKWSPLRTDVLNPVFEPSAKRIEHLQSTTVSAACIVRRDKLASFRQTPQTLQTLRGTVAAGNAAATCTACVVARIRPAITTEIVRSEP